MQVSVVMPTYNRGESLRASLDSLLRSDSTDLSVIEVIVVDDGSVIPSAGVVESIPIRDPFRLRCIRQPNAGPAAARNTGFRASCGEVVIFLDDDVTGPPDLIRKHVEAHALYPGSVIFGRCPFVRPTPTTPLFRFLNSLGWDAGEHVPEDFIHVDVLASNHLSVERRVFDPVDGVYCDDLSTPAAEEWELAYRLRQRGIPLVMATQIVATHHQSTQLRAVCAQQYKHAMGCGEVVMKYPETLNDTALREIVRINGPASSEDSASLIVVKTIKAILSAHWVRRALVKAIVLAERVGAGEASLWGLYRIALSLEFFAGVHDGLRAYSK